MGYLLNEARGKVVTRDELGERDNTELLQAEVERFGQRFDVGAGKRKRKWENRMRRVQGEEIALDEEEGLVLGGEQLDALLDQGEIDVDEVREVDDGNTA